MSDWVSYTVANCPFDKGLLLFSNSRGIYKCSICFREFTDNQIAPYRTAQPAQEKQSTEVTGTFFQSIQPVSGTVTTNAPANASTNLAQVGGSSVSLGAKTAANSIPVVLASDEAALAVTGTFFPATQPVSGTLVISNLPAIGPQQSASSLPVVLASDQEPIAAALRQVGEQLFNLGRQLSQDSLSVTLAADERIIPVAITDGADTLGVLARPVRVDPTGTTAQPVTIQNPQAAISVSNFPALQISQLNDGIGNYDLGILRNQLRELINAQNATQAIIALQSGQFVPQIETLPFLGA